MSEANSNSNRSQQPGLIELVSPPDMTIEERPPLVDFEVVGNMLETFEARNKEIFKIKYLFTLNWIYKIEYIIK